MASASSTISVKATPSSVLQKVFPVVDVALWLKVAGAIPFDPITGSLVYYFPMAHIDHTCQTPILTFENQGILCRIESVEFLGDLDTEEVFAKFVLQPVDDDNPPYWDSDWNGDAEHQQEAPLPAAISCSKELTKTDFNRGVRLNVDTSGAEGVFPCHPQGPALPLSFNDLLQNKWKFKHRYSVADKCYYLSRGNGWSNFSKQKRLEIGDTVIFTRTDDDSLNLAFRRKNLYAAKDYSKFCREKSAQSSIAYVTKEALDFATDKKPFQVIYYPNWCDYLVSPKVIRKSFRTLKRFVASNGSVVTKLSDGKIIRGELIKMADNNGWKMTRVQWNGATAVSQVNAWEIDFIEFKSKQYQVGEGAVDLGAMLDEQQRMPQDL